MATKTVPLDFAGLSILDEGRIEKLLKKHLQLAALDCTNRPMDKTARQVILTFNIVPMVNPISQECEKTSVEIECKSKVPTHRSEPFQMQVHPNGLRFNEDFPDSIDQQPLFPGAEGSAGSPPSA